MERHVMTYEGPWSVGRKTGRVVLSSSGDFGQYLEDAVKECIDRAGPEFANDRWLRVIVESTEIGGSED